MNESGPDCKEAIECRGDFWIMLEKAMDEAGGCIPIERLANMRLCEVVDTVAQNGIRMVYLHDKHMNRFSK